MREIFRAVVDGVVAPGTAFWFCTQVTKGVAMIDRASPFFLDMSHSIGGAQQERKADTGEVKMQRPNGICGGTATVAR